MRYWDVFDGMVRATVEERMINGCNAILEVDTGGPIGSDHLMMIKSTQRADEDWLINRWFYFDEQVEQYAWNFAEKICSDAEYRKRSLDEEADWKRVANTYEPFARRLYQDLSAYTASDFPIMNEESREDRDKLEDVCRQVFEEVRAIIRDGMDTHPDAVFEQQRSSLHEWLNEKYDTAPT